MADKIYGSLNQVLEIDLETRGFSIVKISDQDRKLFLGGKGLGLKFLYDRLEPGIDPLSKDNIIVITTGVVAGTTTPCSGRFHAVFKSPLTNIIGSSSCGGSFGRQLKSCGWDGIIIKGAAKEFVTIHIDQAGVEFKDASQIWGSDIDVTQKQINEKGLESLVIGPAGENLVRFANAASGHRYLGRGGIGAVMGSKNLKAVIVEKGPYKVLPSLADKFNKLKKKSTLYINRNKFSILNRNYGTASNANPIIEQNMLPVENFSYGNHEQAINITGKVIAKKHSTKHKTCKPCSIMCGHKGIFNNQEAVVPEYETLALLGSSIGIFDSDQISSLNQICNQKGMDTISTGGTIAWVMEAGQKGLVKTDLKFGSYKEVEDILFKISACKDFGAKMANGSRALSNEFGGHEFAIQVKGLEMAGYDPRGSYGQGLGYATANRGACHLSSFMIGPENFIHFLKPSSTKGKAQFVGFLENLYCALNSLDICQFTGYAFTLEPFLSKYTPHFITSFIMQHLTDIGLMLFDFSLYPDYFHAVSGIKMSSKEFLNAGERIHVLERLMNTREGITKKDDTLPHRLLFEPQKDDPSKRIVPLDKMIDKYYQKRGYDQNGIPKETLLKRLSIL